VLGREIAPFFDPLRVRPTSMAATRENVMPAARRRILLTALKVFDLAVVAGSFIAGAFAVWPGGILTFSECLSMRVKVLNLVLCSLLLGAWHVAFLACGIYDSKRLAGRYRELLDVVRATVIGSGVLFLLSRAFRIQIVDGRFSAVFIAACAGVSVAGRALLRTALRVARARGRDLRHAIVVGRNRRAAEFARRMESMNHLGYRVIGFVDRSDWDAGPALEPALQPVLGDISEFPQVLRTHSVDEVIVFLPLRSHYHRAMRVAQQCEEQGIPVRFPSRLFDLQTASAHAVEGLDSDPLITLSNGPTVVWPLVAKRFLDVVISAALLVLLAPLFLAVAALIKATSPGPVFFVQERLGLAKRRFRIYKFRTMVADAERRQADLEALNEAPGPVFKIRRDPRITSLGAFLRKTSIDELPQLLNVLCGDISLVGPRPLPVRDYAGFDQDWHRRRFSVRPGITCLWQISGRSDISFDRWMELDIQYIDNWTIWLDLKILFLTIPAVFRGTGAV
jgi:exopolysaccharide biosynthesis polyprenyl glycosylphosphotransferase